MEGYSVKEKRKVKFEPSTIKKLKNGSYLAMGKDSNNNKISKIISKSEAEKYQK